MTSDTFVIFFFFFFFLLPRTLSTTIPQQANAESQLFAQSRRGQEVLARVKQFMKQHVFPAEKVVVRGPPGVLSRPSASPDSPTP